MKSLGEFELLALTELAPFDLEGHLTPQRSNGLHAMLTRLSAMAEDEQARA